MKRAKDMRSTSGALALVFVAAIVSTVVTGCGGPPKAVRSALDVTAHALLEADQEVAPMYAGAANEAYEVSSSRAEYESRMERWNHVEMGLRTSRSALLTAEASVDAWEASEDGARAALGCLATAVTSLAETLQAAGLPVPSKLLQILSVAPALVGACGGGS